jgi:hypothetical protein
VPSPNIDKLKALLDSGWKIKSHQFHLDNTKPTQQTKVRVVLEKAGELTFIEAQNDDEFAVYTFHFKMLEDPYGNHEFTYIQDLEEYNKNEEALQRIGTVPSRPYRIFIGGIKLEKAHLLYFRPAGPQPKGDHFGIASFLVSEVNNANFLGIDFRDEIKIEWEDTNETAFRGFAHKVHVGENSAMFFCRGATRRFFQSQVTYEMIGVSGLDALYLLTMNSGLSLNVQGPNRPLLITREFDVVFPVEGLVIPCDFVIEQVKFTKNIPKTIPEKARKARTLSTQPWDKVSAFAVVTVEAGHFFEALTKAERIAKRAIDWIQFRTDISIPSFQMGEKKISLSYNLSKSFSKCSIVPYGLAVDLVTNGAVFYLLTIQSGHKLVFNYNPDGFFQPLNSLLDRLVQVNKVNPTAIQPLYEALGWLMQTFEVESATDNLIQLWIAMEFICADEKPPKIVKKSNVAKCIAAIKDLKLTKNEEEALVHSLQQTNNPPLMAKWQCMISRLGIKITSEERDLLSKLRQERNNISHGKPVGNITFDEIEKLRSILERVFLEKTLQIISTDCGVTNLSLLY